MLLLGDGKGKAPAMQRGADHPAAAPAPLRPGERVGQTYSKPGERLVLRGKKKGRG